MLFKWSGQRANKKKKSSSILKKKKKISSLCVPGNECRETKEEEERWRNKRLASKQTNHASSLARFWVFALYLHETKIIITIIDNRYPSSKATESNGTIWLMKSDCLNNHHHRRLGEERSFKESFCSLGNLGRDLPVCPVRWWNNQILVAWTFGGGDRARSSFIHFSIIFQPIGIVPINHSTKVPKTIQNSKLDNFMQSETGGENFKISKLWNVGFALKTLNGFRQRKKVE